MHEPEKNKLVDPYYWIKDMNEEERDHFMMNEEEFYDLQLLKCDMLHKQLVREQEFYEHVPQILPIRIGQYIYYRRFDNPADSMTLYRFPLEELSKRGFSEG